MNTIALFSILIMSFIRIIGLGLSLDLFLSQRATKFKILALGWLVLLLAGIFALFTEFIENVYVIDLFLVLNGIFISLGILLLALGFLTYFRPIPSSVFTGSSLSLILIPVLLYRIAGRTPAVNFTFLTLFMVLLAVIIAGLAKRKRLRGYIGHSPNWFYLSCAYGVFTIAAFAFLASEGYSYGMYEATNLILIGVNYFVGISFTLLILILFIYVEHSLSANQKFQLKDVYSHTLGNIIQVVLSAASLAKLEDTVTPQEINRLELIQKKCKTASELIKEIRKL